MQQMYGAVGATTWAASHSTNWKNGMKTPGQSSGGTWDAIFAKTKGIPMSNGYAADEPRHVEMAAIDEDVRRMAIYGAIAVVASMCKLTQGGSYTTTLFRQTSIYSTEEQRQEVAIAIRVLRHFGLLVEHGDGIVSVKEKADYEKS